MHPLTRASPEGAAQASLTQLLETGLLHGDPHPGNLLLTPSGRLAYVDFGLLCRVKRQHSRALEALMVHLTAERWLAAAADLRQLELLKPYTTDEEVAAALEEKMAGRSLLTMRLKDITGVFIRLAVQFRFELPPYYTLLLRSLATLEGIALTADPRYIHSGHVWRACMHTSLLVPIVALSSAGCRRGADSGDGTTGFCSFEMLRAALPVVQAAALRASRHPDSRALVRELVLTPDGGLQWARLPQLARLLRGAPADSVDADATVDSSTALHHSGRAIGSGDDGGVAMAAMAVTAAVLGPSGRGLRRVLLDADGPTVAAELARAYPSLFALAHCAF